MENDYRAQLEYEDHQAELAYENYLKESRNCYQLRQIGVACENCEHRQFKVDLSVPF